MPQAMGNEMKKQRRHTNRQGVQLARRRLSQARRSASRGLFAEQLEDRRLLSADFPFHNPLIPLDVTRDWMVTPRDALVVINDLNSGGSRTLDANAAGGNSGPDAMIDTNQDGRVTPLDALLVINALNDGEGLDGIVMGFRLELQDTNGVKIPALPGVVDEAGQPIFRVHVGDEFRVQIYVDDLRTINDPNGGVFAGALDVAYSDPSLFSMGGTHPDDFTLADLQQFKNFFTAHRAIVTIDDEVKLVEYYSQDFMKVYPSALDHDVANDPTVNEFDELYTFAPNTNPALYGARERRFVFVTLKADDVGKLTFEGNPTEGTNPPPENLLFGAINGKTDNIPSANINYGSPLYVTIAKHVNAEDDTYPVVPSVIAANGGVANLHVLEQR